MAQRKKTNASILIIILIALIPITIIFLVNRSGRNNAYENLNVLKETSKRTLQIEDRFTMIGYVGKNRHPVYIYVMPYSSFGKNNPIDAAFHCNDIDSTQVWLLCPKGMKKSLKGAKYKLDVKDKHFNKEFEVYCSSVEYAEQVFSLEIRKKILDNKKSIQGSWGLVRSRLTYIKKGLFKRTQGSEMDNIIDVGEALIERMHEIANP